MTGFRHFSAFAVCLAFGLAFAETFAFGASARSLVFALAFLFFASGVLQHEDPVFFQSRQIINGHSELIQVAIILSS